jgi:nucleoside-diphosphate-sugar epimerase
LSVQVLILGCGYTGERVARKLLAQGIEVSATSRDPDKFRDLGLGALKLIHMDLTVPETVNRLSWDNFVKPGVRVLHSVPPVNGTDPTPQLLAALGTKPERVVYISTTSVYGDAREVNHLTPAAPVLPSQTVRVAAEQAVLNGNAAGLCLRPAGIYGQGRGVHQRMLDGNYKMVEDGTNFLSRIHVEDLAEHCVAALLRPEPLTGAYPVADAAPCSSLEIVEFCAQLLNLPMPPRIAAKDAHETQRVHRKVDGSYIRELLGIELKYPSYREGIRASIIH